MCAVTVTSPIKGVIMGSGRLVLTRKKNEDIRIGDNITITIVEISRGRVKIGVTAPKDVLVEREENVRRESDNKQNGD